MARTVTGPLVCSIGSSDPWNAAGIGLDVRALAECGAYPLTVVAGVTAQDRWGVRAAASVAPDLVVAQLAALAGAEIAAYRIGAMLDAATVDVVAEHLARTRVPRVYDPVLAPSGGGSFVDARALAAIRGRLLPVVTVVTPNLAEAARLADVPVADTTAMAVAGQRLVALGAEAALVKGGHLAGRAVDVLVEANEVTTFEDERISATLRGTGCLLAVALAVALARGTPLPAAVSAARAFVRAKLTRARTRGGMRVAY